MSRQTISTPARTAEQIAGIYAQSLRELAEDPNACRVLGALDVA